MTLQQITKELEPYDARLVAISKTQPLEAIEKLYQQGQRIFGENKVQELVQKYNALPKDISWHLVGHLQTNKVKEIVPFVDMIHSVDSLKLLESIQHEAQKVDRKINILLQIHIAQEDTKFGLDALEVQEILERYFANKKYYSHIQISGVMGMATFTQNTQQITNEFIELKNTFTLLKNTYFPFDRLFKEISMGMSADYLLALPQGATLVRIGSLLFGQR